VGAINNLIDKEEIEAKRQQETGSLSTDERVKKSMRQLINRMS
jgi:predicted RNA binding protein with dsRBD fold (UPF0201 family)